MARTMPDRLYDPQELADYLKVPIGTVYQWNHRGGGPPFIKIGKHVRYRGRDVDQWIEERTQQPRATAS